MDLLKPEEVASILKISKYTVYEMVKRGELEAIRIGRKMRFDPTAIKRFTNSGTQIEDQQLVANKNEKSSNHTLHTVQDVKSEQAILFLGSHDLAIEELGSVIRSSYPSLHFFTAFIGSMDGLLNLYFGKADIAGCHLFDAELEQYNVPFVRRIFPGEDVQIVHFVKRNLGWIVPKGNPNKIMSWDDLNRPTLKIINRQKGSGTRILLDYHLKKMNLLTEDIHGYNEIEQTHFSAASKIARGMADMALGTESAARALGLDFVYLIQESYDFIMKPAFYYSSQGQSVISALKSPSLYEKIKQLGGYDIESIGELVQGGISYDKN